MQYKEDLEDAQRRTVAWMNCAAVDRPAIPVTAPKDGVDREPFSPPVSVEQQWLDIDYRLAAAAHHFERTYFGGEAVPSIFINLGPDVLAAGIAVCLILIPWLNGLAGVERPKYRGTSPVEVEEIVDQLNINGDLGPYIRFRLAAAENAREDEGKARYHESRGQLSNWNL